METYSILNNFGNIIPNIGQLHNEIVNEVSITKSLYGISQYEDDVNIIFETSISGPEKIILDNIVSNHVVVVPTPNINNKLTIYSKKDKINNTSFVRVGSDIFEGSTYATAKSISFVDSDATSYDILIYDKTNKNILLSVNLSNNQESIQELGELTNLPTSTCQIEISVKKNGGIDTSNVHVECVIICYN